MSILTDESLEFARTHIQRYYDSDFFPKPFEFEAIWCFWDDVKRFLTSTNVHKLPVMPAKAAPWPKHRGGFRVVHQLDPIDSIVYAALVYQIANQVEQTRIDSERAIACAYRIELDDGSFFAAGNGYDQYREQSKAYAENYRYVLLVDVADFYNQIYLHRVNNALEHSCVSPSGLADDIEGFLGKLNSKISQGLPVGPAASIVLAEAVMIDVDQHVIALGHPHTRYVDDFRIFANSEHELLLALQSLTLYLYQNHRLSVSHEKTRLIMSDEFLRSDINNPYEVEKLEIFEKLDALSGYGSPETLDPITRSVATALDPEKTAEAENTVVTALEAMADRKILDLGYARALLRQARLLNSERAAILLLKNISFFSPLANNLCVFLNAVISASNARQLNPHIESAFEHVLAYGGPIRYWFEWFIANNYEFLGNGVRNCLRGSPFLMSQAKYAVISKDLGWVRRKKNEYFQFGPYERYAILYASQILPNDEKTNWLKSIIDSSHVPLEKWVAKYANRAPDDFDDEIPF